MSLFKKYHIFLFLTLTLFRLSAETIDTSIVSDGSPGPYTLGKWFVDTSSLSVSFTDTTDGITPPFTFIDECNGILFSEAIDSGRTLLIRYNTKLYGLPKTYRVYSEHYLDTSDTSIKTYIVKEKEPDYFRNAGKMHVSGYKSIGVSFGGGGNMNLEQALDVSISGKISPNTEISANLNDQGTSLDGATREIGEIDMVFIELDNPKYHARIGDQYVSMPERGLLYGRKKIKGVSAGLSRPFFHSDVFGAISGGKYTVQIIEGQLGFQGPYSLTGEGEKDLINPVAGTVKISVNGEKLKEGYSNDYVVDYDLGTITFTSNFPVHDDQIIRIEYEYKKFDYQRFSFGGDAGASLRDSIISVSGALWTEMDNKDHPLEIDLDSTDLASLESAGDSTPMLPSGRRIKDPDDIIPKSALTPLYHKRADSNGNEYYEYEPEPADSQVLYEVWFRKTENGNNGYYKRDSVWNQNRYQHVYSYDPTGTSGYTSLSPFPAPKRSTMGEISLKINPFDWLKIDADIAGEENDLNLFSEKDDGDNTAPAFKTGLFLGKRDFTERSLWITGKQTYVSQNFSQTLIDPYMLKSNWNRNRETLFGYDNHLWESSLGMVIFPGVSTEFFYGQFIKDKNVKTEKVFNKTKLSKEEFFSFSNTAGLFLHRDRDSLPATHIDTVRLVFNYDLLTHTIHGDDYWSFGEQKNGRGSIGGGTIISLNPFNLNESVYYRRELKGSEFMLSPDTAAMFEWKQDFDISPLSGWSLKCDNTFRRQRMPRDTVSVVLVNFKNSIISPKTGLTTHQEYNLTSEKSTSIIQIPVYAGEGLGFYSYDSTLEEYVIDAERGSYFIEEKEVYDSSYSSRTRKNSLKGSWSFSPPVKKGLLADLSFSGNFMLEEHLDISRNIPSVSWIPGFITLSDGSDTIISYGNTWYRQNISFFRREAAALRSSLFIKPSKRKIRRYFENGLVWGGDLTISPDPWHFNVEGEVLSINRLYLTGNSRDSVMDRHLTLKQRRRVPYNLTVFLEETGGWAEKRGTESINSSDGSNLYFRLKPGISFNPEKPGFAEVSYTYSRVDIPGSIEYQMAQGFRKGISHIIDFMISINAGKHFSINGSYRGEYNKIDVKRSTKYRPGMHVFSMEVKAFL